MLTVKNSLTTVEIEHLKDLDITLGESFLRERARHRHYSRVDRVPLERVCPICHEIEQKTYAV